MIRVVAAALVRRGRVLVGRRAPHQRNGGLWELPGGKVEPGESDAEALRRELQEELAVDVHVQGELAAAVHGYEWGSICLVALRCVLCSGEPSALEHAELRWVDAKELRELDLAPADRPLVEAVIASLGRSPASPPQGCA